MSKSKYIKPPTANELTNAVVKFLGLHGYMVWRQNNTGVFDPTAALGKMRPALRGGLTPKQREGMCKRAMQKSFRNNPGINGLPDVIGFHRKTGVWIAAEIKAGKDKLRPEQKHFLETLHKSGGECYVVRSTEQFVNEWCAYHRQPSPFERKRS